MKSFNKNIFVISIVILGLLLIPSFFAAWGADEGDPNQSFPWPLLRLCFEILRFPSHTLFWNFILRFDALYFLGFAFNIIFYSFIIERLFFFVRKFRKDKSDKETGKMIN